METKSKYIKGIAILMIWGISSGFISNDTVWQKISSGINENVVNCIAVHPEDNNLIFAGTPKALYRSVNKGQSYQSVLTLQGSMKGVNYLYIGLHGQQIFAATDSGLFVSLTKGDRWDKIYDSQDPQSRRCLTVIDDQHFVYVGTPHGLFSKSINSPIWHRQEGSLGNRAIYDLSRDQDYIYIATDAQLYRFNREKQEVKKIFTLSYQEKNGTETTNGDEGDTLFLRKIKDLVVLSPPFDKFPPPGQGTGRATHIYLATDKGIFHSTDQGETWKRFPGHGLPLEDITSITAFYTSPASHGQGEAEPEFSNQSLSIFAGTKRGIYRYEDMSWLPLYKGLETNDIRFLASDMQGMVYVATSRGIFSSGREQTIYSQQASPIIPDFTEIKEKFKHELSILEVQELAIDYAEVSPDKIKGWRTASRTKAILPDLSVGIDRAATDLYHWNTGANPDELQKGRDYLDWDISVSWDLADLIWSTAQTTIDSRSKAMVELREDILDQITRLYFERRRIQVELMSASNIQPQMLIDRKMRIEELTALIDALTGGEFSQRNAGSRRGKEVKKR